MSVPLLQIRDLHVSYGPIAALRGIDLDVNEGEVVAVIGPNGAGKTTLLKTLSGLLRPSSGSIRFAGTALENLAPHKIVERGLLHVPEGRMMLADMTVLENLQMGAFLRRDDEDIRADLEDMYRRFPVLQQRSAQKAGTLSGGEQQMLAIARALMGRPRLLMMDEPSLGLAPLVVSEVFRTVAGLNREALTVLLVEQNARQALRVASRGYALEVGRVVNQGPSEVLSKHERVLDAYLGGRISDRPRHSHLPREELGHD